MGTSFGCCLKGTTTNNTGAAILTCWMTGRSAFENFRMVRGVGSNSLDCRILRPESSFHEAIRLDSDSPHIAFRASMKNVSGHTVEWAMQSVSQYDTGNPKDPSHSNREIWGFTPSNPSSGYLNRYHVRTGPAENPAATIRDDGLFSLHYSHLAAEFWVDSTDGWLAVVDGNSRYAMVERFQYQELKPYPGKGFRYFLDEWPSSEVEQRRCGVGERCIRRRVSLLYGSRDQ